MNRTPTTFAPDTRRHFIAAAATAVLLAGGLVSLPAPAQARAVVNVQIGVPPPPLRIEAVPAPRRGHVWAPGHWEWRRGGHVWMPGTWIVARPGYVYRAPQWVEHDGRWNYRGGRWDRDGDGVPDRYDSRPNNPNRR